MPGAKLHPKTPAAQNHRGKIGGYSKRAKLKTQGNSQNARHLTKNLALQGKEVLRENRLTE
jgi:hypothetical protein